ncbi:MAG: ATP-binding protein, partial [Rhizobiales bacterium]|nr:ATP-binding protein [Hyphomicrobiales bacterium]
MSELRRSEQDREAFLQTRNAYLTSARPIQSPEHLKGRQRALQSLCDALTSPGRHAFIYGFRGVGKSSLAQTTAFKIHTATSVPIILGCEPSSTFAQICTDVVRIALGSPPLETKSRLNLSFGANVAGYGAQVGVDRAPSRSEIDIESVNDAIRYFKHACERFPPGFTVVIDELDQLTNPE